VDGELGRLMAPLQGNGWVDGELGRLMAPLQGNG